jgi:hypothetical protein
MRSAVASPIKMPWLRRTYCVIASSNLSPAHAHARRVDNAVQGDNGDFRSATTDVVKESVTCELRKRHFSLEFAFVTDKPTLVHRTPQTSGYSPVIGKELLCDVGRRRRPVACLLPYRALPTYRKMSTRSNNAALSALADTRPRPDPDSGPRNTTLSEHPILTGVELDVP